MFIIPISPHFILDHSCLSHYSNLVICSALVAGCRQLPTSIVLFLSNLPRSVVSFPFYSLEKVVTQIEEIYDDKFASDQVDLSDGVAREELVRIYFVTYYCIMVHI